MRTIPLAEVKPGQRVHAVVMNGDVVPLPSPRLVKQGLHEIDDSGVMAVELHMGRKTTVQYMLYADRHQAVQVTTECGHGGIDGRFRAASKVAKELGWTVSGGCYFDPRGEYTGKRGALDMFKYALANRYIVEHEGRWFLAYTRP